MICDVIIFPFGNFINSDLLAIMTSNKFSEKKLDITLPTKIRLVKAMVFPVVIYECESWTVKKAEHQRIDAFDLWCWRKLESPLDSEKMQPVNPKGNQS